MPAGTASAPGIDGAIGLAADVSGIGRLTFQAAEGKALGILHDAYGGSLAGEHPGDENGHAVSAAYALHVCAQGVAIQGQDLVLAHKRPPVVVMAYCSMPGGRLARADFAACPELAIYKWKRFFKTSFAAENRPEYQGLKCEQK